MVSFSASKTAKFLISDVIMAHVPTHFSGRTLICGGPGVCPVCPFERPRLKSYVVAVVMRKIELVELCASMRACVDEAMRAEAAESLAGLVVVTERTAVRRPWRLVDHGFRPDLVMQADSSPMAWMLADLYRLPTVDGLESVADVVKRGGIAHAPALRGTLLPGLA